MPGESSYVERVPAPALAVLTPPRPLAYGEVVDAINAVVPGANIRLPAGRDPDRPPDNYLDATRPRADTGFPPEYDVERAVPDHSRLAQKT
ncbi:MAG: NAD(P)-dependent oxidoreductase [Pseudonocardia sp.]|nr:NAD(P)-dependent oxidoreductase [Pseudonocardia sp.]MBO0874816.1 NAD(P)-dependent oxidoreductase [Pseudonocardia sp.]